MGVASVTLRLPHGKAPHLKKVEQRGPEREFEEAARQQMAQRARGANLFRTRNRREGGERDGV